MPFGLADDGVLALDPAAHVVTLERQHPRTQLAGGDHALQAATPNAWVDQTRILDLFGIVVEEATELGTVYAGLERLHQLDHKCLLITDLHVAAAHLRLPFSRTRCSRCTGVPGKPNSSRSLRFKKRR